MLDGWGLGLVLAQVPYSTWVLGEVLLCLPIWEFKGLAFWVLEHSCLLCP